MTRFVLDFWNVHGMWRDQDGGAFFRGAGAIIHGFLPLQVDVISWLFLRCKSNLWWIIGYMLSQKQIPLSIQILASNAGGWKCPLPCVRGCDMSYKIWQKILFIFIIYNISWEIRDPHTFFHQGRSLQPDRRRTRGTRPDLLMLTEIVWLAMIKDMQNGGVARNPLQAMS